MRVCLKISYDGTSYHGWQYQEGQETIEGQIQKALHELLGTSVETIGASRTDAGVHALGNVAVFDTNSTIPPEKYSYALNDKLPNDIRILESKSVKDDFNPRFDAKNKTYEYRIYNGEVMIPTKRLYAYHYRGKLDVKSMCVAAGFLEGEHNFKSFSSVHTQAKSFVRTIYSCKIITEGKDVIIRINGNGFLYNMVRIISGTILEVGAKKIIPDDMIKILKKEDRSCAGSTLPPQGLTLMEINYD